MNISSMKPEKVMAITSTIRCPPTKQGTWNYILQQFNFSSSNSTSLKAFFFFFFSSFHKLYDIVVKQFSTLRDFFFSETYLCILSKVAQPPLLFPIKTQLKNKVLQL